MKILKPGKVEMRKFVCPKCGCEFIAMPDDCEWAIPQTLCCPQKGCDAVTEWGKGEPYEEPTQDDRKRLEALISETPDVKIWPGALAKITEHLIANGVTFREG